ncbi:hypothetical protein AB0M45_31550 [Nocardia sp. NPDC051787]
MVDLNVRFRRSRLPRAHVELEAQSMFDEAADHVLQVSEELNLRLA